MQIFNVKNKYTLLETIKIKQIIGRRVNIDKRLTMIPSKFYSQGYKRSFYGELFVRLGISNFLLFLKKAAKKMILTMKNTTK